MCVFRELPVGCKAASQYAELVPEHPEEIQAVRPVTGDTSGFILNQQEWYRERHDPSVSLADVRFFFYS